MLAVHGSLDERIEAVVGALTAHTTRSENG
jgi:hypothetical protein